MTASAAQVSAWQPDRRFWIKHFWLPLMVAGVVLFFLEHSTLDLWLADQWFALQGGQWAWRNHWISSGLIHHHGKQLIIAIGLSALLLLVISFLLPAFRYWRAPMAYLFATMAAVTALIASAKRLSPVDCPWDLSRYGGDLPYLRNFAYSFDATGLGHCFPAGHASGGFILLAMYFAALPLLKKPQRLLLPGLLIGWIFALGQQSRGAHFLSHDLWSLGLCWFGALAMFLLFRPALWYRPLTSTGSS